MTMQSDSEQQYYTQSHTDGFTPRSYRIAFVVIILIATSLVAWSLLSAAMTVRNKGTLIVQVSDKTAAISLLQANHPTIHLGQGDVRTRLNPGIYSIVATSGNTRSLKTISVTARSTATTSLTLRDNTKYVVAARYNASDLFNDNNSTYFLNNDTKVPNVLAANENTSRPLKTTSYPANRLRWVDASNFFILRGGVWQYATGDTITNLNIKDYAANGPTSPDTIAFAANGAYAFIDNNGSVKYTATPTGMPVEIGKVKAGYRVTILPDNSIVVYPNENNTSPDKKILQLKSGKSAALQVPAIAVSTMVWSSDSQKSIYITDSGVHLFNSHNNGSQTIISASVDKQTPTWIGNDILFTYDNALWFYSTSAQEAYTLMTYEGKASYTPPIISKDTILFSTIDTTNKGEGRIYRVAPSTSSSTLLPSDSNQQTTATYQNFSKLTKYGTSSDQLANVRYATAKFTTLLKLAPKTISVSNITSVPKAEEDIKSALTFTLTIDNNSYNAKIEYWGVSSAHLYIYNSTGTTVFDSGDLN